MYQIILGDDKEYSELQKKAEQKAENVIELALKVIGDKIGSGDKSAIRTKMREFIAGENGIIDPEDLMDDDYIRTGLQRIINAWFEEGAQSIGNMSRLRGIFDTIFKDDMLKESYIQSFESEMQSIAESDELTNAVMNTFAQLISAGLSPQALTNILEQTLSLSEWGDIGIDSLLSQYLANNVLGFEDSLEFDALFTKLVGDDLVELDAAAMAMMANLSATGVTLQDFISLFNSPDVTTLQDFKDKLASIGEELNTLDKDSSNAEFSLKSFMESSQIKAVKDFLDTLTTPTSVQSIRDMFSSAGLGEKFQMPKEGELFVDWIERLKSSLDAFQGEDFNSFIQASKKLDEAQKALAKLTSEDGVSPEDAEKYGKVLNEIFSEFDLASLEGTDEYVKRATELTNQLKELVLGDAANYGDFGKGIIAYFTGAMKDDGLTNFVEQVGKLVQAKDALNTFKDLLSGKDVDDSKISSAAKALKEIFPDKNLDPKSETFIEDLTAAVASLDAEALSTADSIGDVGQAIYKAMTEGKTAVEQFKYATADIVESVIATGNRDAIGAYINNAFGGGNVDLLNLTASNGYMDTSTFSNAAGTRAITVTPMLPNGEVLSDEAFNKYVSYLLETATDALEADKLENGGKGIVIFSEDNVANIDEAIQKQRELVQLLHELQEAYHSDASLTDFASQAAKDIDKAKAAANNYKNELASLKRAYTKNDAKALADAWAKLGAKQEEITKKFPALIAALGKMVQAKKAVQEGTGSWEEYYNAMEKVRQAFDMAETANNAKYFKDTANALLEAANAGKDYTDALAAFNTEQATAIKAQAEYDKLVADGGVTAETTTSSVENLAKALNMDAQAVLDNWDLIGPMLEDLGEQMEEFRQKVQQNILVSITGTADADFSPLMNGFAEVQNEADATVQALLKTGEFEIEEKELEQEMQYFAVDSWFPFQGHWESKPAGSIVKTLQPKGGGGVQTKTDTGKSKGGGGGGGKQETTTGSSRVLDTMDKVHTLETNNRNLYAQQAEYYKKTGDDASYAEARTKEIEALNDINNSLRVNIEELEKWIDLKKEELNTLDESSDKYTEVAEELEALQERHYEYTTELLSNESELFDQIVAALEEQDNKAKSMLEGTIENQEAILGVMKEQKSKQDSMLQGRVNVEKLILSTLEQQEALVDSMMNGRIKMENTILNIIKAQINAERQLLSAVVAVENKISSIIQAQASMQKSMMQGRVNMENTIAGIIKSNLQKQKEDALAAANAANEANQKQIEALEKQKELLDEQLKLRKEAAKEQDKQAKLAELESQYARISADPTRMKEALKIKQQIDDLRDEIAWDIAQKEVDAQKKVIDEEIERLREIDYTAGVAEMYDAMINDTEAIMKKVEEMLDTMTDNEIIEWLKENDADYAVSSKTSQKLQVMEWRDMLDEMHGIQKDYTEEVAQIMELSSDEIFEWLQKNDDEYKRASDASKKVMEAEWKEMLANMEGTTENYVERVASILQQPRDEILEWLKKNDEEYAQASDTRREKMVKDWNTALDEMYGTTKTRWDEINAIMSQGLDGFLEYMEEYNTEYANMSEAEKERTALGWAETWREMTGEVEDHNAEMEAVIAQGHDAYIEYLKANSETYKTATAATQQSMLQTWEDSWDKMNGVTNKYEDEAHSIIAQGQEAIIATLTGYTDDYRKIGEAQSSEYVGAWSEQIEALMSQLASLSGAVQSMGGTVDTALADAAEKIEDFQYSLVLSPEGKNETNADIANETISTILKAVEEINLVPTKKYASGGLIDYTGLAWMDGTSYQPERVLSPYQTELFEILVRSMEQMSKIAVPSFPSFGGFAGGAGGGLTFGDIIVNVERLDSETDYDDMAERVLDSVMGKINRSSVVGGIRYSR